MFFNNNMKKWKLLEDNISSFFLIIMENYIFFQICYGKRPSNRDDNFFALHVCYLKAFRFPFILLKAINKKVLNLCNFTSH